MFLMFALRRPDVLPTGDLGIRAAIKKAFGLPELPKPAEMERIAAAWRPYCSIASWYLWRSLDNAAPVAEAATLSRWPCNASLAAYATVAELSPGRHLCSLHFSASIAASPSMNTAAGI